MEVVEVTNVLVFIVYVFVVYVYHYFNEIFILFYIMVSKR